MLRPNLFSLSRAGVLLLAALILPLSACDSGGSNEDDPNVEDGRVNVSISGEASGSFEGFAFFFEETDPETGQTVFGLVLSNTNTETPDMSGQFILIARQSSRPGAGTYSFANVDSDSDDSDLLSDQFIALVSSAAADENIFGFYFSSGGTLTIERSSGDAVTGTFEINATGFQLTSGSQEPEEVDITVEGAFNANPSPTFFFPLGSGTTN